MVFLIFSVLIIMMCGINIYLSHRVWQFLHYIFPQFSIYTSVAFFSIMTIIMILSITNPFNGYLRKTISFIGSYWMGIFVYLLLFFLISDILIFIIRMFNFQMPKVETLRYISGICVIALTAIVSLYGFFHANKLYIVEYDVKIHSNNGYDMKIILISDLHLGAVGSEEKLENIVDKINEQNPDLVCISGDIFNTDFKEISNPEKAQKILCKIESKYGTYACLGNHDSGKTFELMTNFLDKANIKLLKDEYAIIDNRLILAGRLDSSPINGAGDLKRGTPDDVLEGADKNIPIVVLDHNPAHVEEYTDDVDLVLSGHTHKGQIFPASFITNAMFPVDYGYYCTNKNVNVIVTSGVNTWGMPMRVGTNCEIVKINLTY